MAEREREEDVDARRETAAMIRSDRGDGLAPRAHVLLPRLLPEHVLDGRHSTVEAGVAEGRRDGEVGERVVGHVGLGDEVGAAAAAFVDGVPGEGAKGVVVARVGEKARGLVPRGDLEVGGLRGRVAMRGDADGGSAKEGMQLLFDVAFDVDGVIGRVVVDEGEVDVDGDAVHGLARAVDALVGHVEDTGPFALEANGFVEEDDVFAVEAFLGAELVKGFVVRGLHVEAIVEGFHVEHHAARRPSFDGGGGD